jgi:hypothetical protein
MADTPTQVVQQQSGFAPEIAPYAQRLLGRAESLFDEDYMQYQPERTAGFSPLQQMSYDNAALMQSQPQLQDATAMAGLAGLGALNTSYTYNPYDSTAVHRRHKHAARLRCKRQVSAGYRCGGAIYVPLYGHCCCAATTRFATPRRHCPSNSKRASCSFRCLWRQW